MHTSNIFWFSIYFGLFYQWFWLWFIDGLGWVRVDWVWQIFCPLDGNGDYKIVDEWVAVNTWTLAYTIQIIEKDTGVTFDANNEIHVAKLHDFVWPYLYEQLNLVNSFGTYGWVMNTILIVICPKLYVDADGYAVDGYPMIMAKSLELSKMYWGDYTWLADPKNRRYKLDMFSFEGILFNVSWGWCWYFL